MAATKPTILLIPGAWSHPSTYDVFISHLQHLSFPIAYVPYPSLNPSHPAPTDAAHDVKTVLQKSLLPLIQNEGKDVVIVMHSYGGVPGSSAARGLSKVQRSKKGENGGVVGLIYVSGIVLPSGASVADGVGGQLPAWVKENEVRPPSQLTTSFSTFVPSSICHIYHRLVISIPTRSYSLPLASQYPIILSPSSSPTSNPLSQRETRRSWSLTHYLPLSLRLLRLRGRTQASKADWPTWYVLMTWRYRGLARRP